MAGGLRNILNHGHQLSPNAEGYLRMNGTTYQVGRWPNEAVASAPGAADVGSGQWVHLVGQYNGTRWEFYRNGMLVGASRATANGAIQFSPDNVGWGIGARGTGTERFFGGLVDEVALYDHALDADRISAHYSLGSTNALASFDATGATNVAPLLGSGFAIGL